MRNRSIGFVFQTFNLLARTPALENVELPLVYAGVAGARAPQRARWRCSPSASGSASAPTTSPRSSPAASSSAWRSRARWSREPLLILADEPTGALDSRTSLEIMALLQELNREGMTVVLVTHEPDVARFARRILRFRDGHLVEDQRNETPTTRSRCGRPSAVPA